MSTENPKSEDTLESLMNQNKEIEDKYVRLYADFENYKKRSIKERNDLERRTKYNILSSFLDILDDLELAKKSMGDDDGINIILNKINNFLSSNGIEEVDTNCKFTPDLHECITTVPDVSGAGDRSGHIMEVIKRGYSINGSIVRYPKVVVIN